MPKLPNPKQETFCQEYLVREQGEAARVAGYSPRTASIVACNLLKKPEVQARIAELQRNLQEATGVTHERVMQYWWQIIDADPNELSQNRVGCCRYCYGADHGHQWKTPREFAAEKVAAAARLRTDDDLDPRLPTDAGGYGYDIRKRPNPDCPECNGLGVQYQVFPDSTALSPEARAAYRGVKVTRNGIEVMQADKDQTMAQIAKSIGMFIDRKQVDMGQGWDSFIQAIMGGKAPVAK